MSALGENSLDIFCCPDVVDYLLLNGFSSLSYDVKVRIEKIVRPTPSMPSLVFTSGKQNRGFSDSNYKKIEWLTASTVRNKLYCWKCPLFTNDQCSIWGRAGFNNLQNLSRGLERHERSQENISSCIQFEMLGKQQNLLRRTTHEKKYYFKGGGEMCQ